MAPSSNAKKIGGDSLNLSKHLFFSAAFAIAFALLAIPFTSQAATLAVSPASGTYKVGQTFAVSVSVAAPSQTLNAASATISYSKDTMEIISVSKSPSIFSLWVQEPAYSNQSGIASFEGVVLNPGFTGNSGRLITYTFRAKSAGNGSVRVTNGSILANDGNGTDIFTGSGSTSFTFTPSEKVLEKPEASELPAPTVINSELPPILQIKEIARDDLTNPIAAFIISVVNTKEVFKKYQVRIDQNEPIVWVDEAGTGIFTTPKLQPGSHTLLVKTLDNKKIITGYVDFLVDSLEQPKIIYSTKIASANDPAVVYGTTKKGALVTVSLKNGAEEIYSQEAVVDAEGKFIMISSEKIPRGVYVVDVFVHSATGARSPAIAGVKMKIVSDYYVKIGPVIIEGYLLIFILGIALLALLLREIFARKRQIVAEPSRLKKKKS